MSFSVPLLVSPIFLFFNQLVLFVFTPRNKKRMSFPVSFRSAKPIHIFTTFHNQRGTFNRIYLLLYIGHRFVSVVPHTSQFMLVAVFFSIIFFTRLLFQFFVIMLLWTCLTIRIPPLKKIFWNSHWKIHTPWPRQKTTKINSLNLPSYY